MDRIIAETSTPVAIKIAGTKRPLASKDTLLPMRRWTRAAGRSGCGGAAGGELSPTIILPTMAGPR